MQDIHAIGGGAGRLFTAGGGGGGVGGVGGDKRLRPHSHQNHQPLKCPRCDSLNTKFCYYNNYNLSQPRHFCKSCRRYWTKGGVLRSVPVGGGCRKSKRSKPKPSSSVTESPTADDVAQQEQKSNSHSSSESSSLTGATAANTTAGATMEVVSATNSNFPNFADSSTFFISQNSTDHPTFDHQIFSDIGSFTNLMTSSSEPALMGFSSVDISPYRLQLQNEETPLPLTQKQPEPEKPVTVPVPVPEPEMNTHTTGYLDNIDFSALQQQQNRGSNGGFSASVTGCGEQGMFDFTGAIDQTFWTSQQQWADHDHSLHFLP